jgi:hypothetical protein
MGGGRTSSLRIFRVPQSYSLWMCAGSERTFVALM